MDAVDELQEYFYVKVSNVFDDMNIHVGTSRRGQSLDLPLGIVALQALNYLIDFLREIIQNVEMLAEEYSSEELKVLLDKSTHTSNWTTFKQMIADLIQLIIDCNFICKDNTNIRNIQEQSSFYQHSKLFFH